MGAFEYNIGKLNLRDEKQRAELLDTNFTSLNTAQVRKEVNWIKSLRSNLSRYVYHTSINFNKAEVLDNATLLNIAHDYLRESGYFNNQYFIFRHYDAGHPHLHLLVNRIDFDGNVVSDSNNYKRSEAILRKLEHQYNLITVDSSTSITEVLSSDVSEERDIERMTGINHHIIDEQYTAGPSQSNSNIPIAQANKRKKEQANPVSLERNNVVSSKLSSRLSGRAANKDEIEMAIRTGKPSDKMLIQEFMREMLSSGKLTTQELIAEGEKSGIHFLFNQASTGRVFGITYFHEGFKITGQKLGKSFKWAELIKIIDYEQTRDREAISAANIKTKTVYGDNKSAGDGQRGAGFFEDPKLSGTNIIEQQRNLIELEQDCSTNGVIDSKTAPDNLGTDNYSSDLGNVQYNTTGIQISDDIDDEAILGRNRKKQKQARTNRR